MKIILLTAILFLSFSTVFTQELKLEQFKTEHYSIEYPSDWITEKQTNGDVYFYPLYDFNNERPFGVSICRVTDINTSEYPGEVYVTMLATSISQFKGASITNQEVKDINDHKAYIIEYENAGADKNEMGKIFLFRKGAVAYQITVNGTSKAYRDFEMFGSMIGNSFVLE